MSTQDQTTENKNTENSSALSTESQHNEDQTIDVTTNVTRMPSIQARVSSWIYIQGIEKINQILEELNMIRLDNNFENQRWLQENLLGKYNPNDFMIEPDIAADEVDNFRQLKLKQKQIV